MGKVPAAHITLTIDGNNFTIDPLRDGEVKAESFAITWQLMATPDLIMANVSITAGKPMNIRLTSDKQESAFLIFPTSHRISYQQAALPADVIRADQFQFVFVPALDTTLHLSPGTFSFFSFQFTPGMLKTWMPEPIIRDFLEHINRKRPALINATPMEITPPMANVLQELKTGRPEKRFELWLESRALDLLRMALDELNPDTLIYSTPLKPDDIENIRNVKQYIDEKLDAPLSLSDLAEKGGMSESKLKSVFKEFYHSTVFEYIRSRRLQRARMQLLETDLDIKAIAFKAGYRSVSNFSTAFRKAYSVSPNALRRR